MSDNEHLLKEKIRSAFTLAEKYSWIFYVIILALLIPFRFGWIDAQETVIDFIIAISLISITAQAVNRLRNKENGSSPYIRCQKCQGMIESTGTWTCKNMFKGKVCGWTATFPDN